jgi:hypothetical protein
LGVVILLATAASGQSQEPKPVRNKRAKPPAAALPVGPPPSFMLVSGVNLEARELTMLHRVMVPVVVEREVEVEVDGMKVRERRAVTVLQQEERTQLMSLDHIVASAGGKRLESDEAWKALRGQIVLVTSTEKLDPAYAKLLSKDAVTITTKTSKRQP